MAGPLIGIRVLDLSRVMAGPWCTQIFADLVEKGLGYDALRKDNPGLVYCSITGFGQTGPMSEDPGYDYLIQAQGGLMSITGVPDGQPGAGPQRVGLATTCRGSSI